MQKRTVALVGGAHFILDGYMGFFGVYLVIAGLDPVKSALISTVTMFVGNILQPFMGYTADRLRGKLPLFTGLLLASAFMSAVGITRNYTVLFIFVLFGTLGSSIDHGDAHDGDVGGELEVEVLPVVGRNEHDRLDRVVPVEEFLRRVQPDRPASQQGEGLFVVLVLEAGASPGSGQDHGELGHGGVLLGELGMVLDPPLSRLAGVRQDEGKS